MNSPKYNKEFEKYGGEIFFGKNMIGEKRKKGRKNQIKFISKICKIEKK